jgi:hypothetical protein
LEAIKKDNRMSQVIDKTKSYKTNLRIVHLREVVE